VVGDAVVVRGQIWWAATPSGDRPVLVLTRDPVADRIEGVVVAACTRTARGLTSELSLGPSDGMGEECVASFDNLHTLRKSQFRRRIATLPPDRDDELCAALDAALGCPR
jgi:mRNA interferase MazF